MFALKANVSTQLFRSLRKLAASACGARIAKQRSSAGRVSQAKRLTAMRFLLTNRATQCEAKICVDTFAYGGVPEGRGG